jgi:hypothetical protein
VRLATGGPGRLPDGELLIDLQNIFGEQAGKLASIFLSICIHALDYRPQSISSSANICAP